MFNRRLVLLSAYLFFAARDMGAALVAPRTPDRICNLARGILLAYAFYLEWRESPWQPASELVTNSLRQMVTLATALGLIAVQFIAYLARSSR